ncbi:hypothetical protein L593_08730 [Salinarchaeum sp. Harcht-Bsk1]|uniref:hypothetical protein n=1 Tax=Salinarchaeum sp. Harcht-Bsk1 TaxID=1333523 RepID=UPI0003424826|nr:hypothetical protein [Salinarchaeum sp. Harcht-Bsk1]AGN01691.1 hypothetical protein L593_08730 [Salinarchaeum sp. Harcht-Bsk1]
MIVVATEDFEVYHDVVAELRDRDAAFTTVEPGEALPERATVLIVAADEMDDVRAAHPDLGPEVEVVGAEPGEARTAVEAALQLARSEGGQLVVGVDPGDRPGIAVLVGDTVVAAYHVPLAQVAEIVREEVADAPDPIVRIGDGARLQGSRLIDALGDVRVELVDETGTTPSLGAGASGLGDVIAAVNIAQREGEVIEERDVEPTVGELRRIQERSRERGEDNRAIDELLARRVASGELTVEEALDTHREER